MLGGHQVGHEQRDPEGVAEVIRTVVALSFALSRVPSVDLTLAPSAGGPRNDGPLSGLASSSTTCVMPHVPHAPRRPSSTARKKRASRTAAKTD